MMEHEQVEIGADIKSAIESAQEKYLRDKSHRDKWRSIRASGIGDPCPRRIYYMMTEGDLDPISTDLVAIFQEGVDQEPGVRRYLSELGFELLKSQVTASWQELGISGSIDGILEYQGKQMIAEIKTVSPYAWEKLQTIGDFNEGYYKKWYAQIQTYMVLHGIEDAIFILKSKEAKKIRIVPVKLDYDYAESLLKKAEAVRDAVVKHEPPDFLKDNIVECKRCPFFQKLCNPPMDYGEVIPNVEDEELNAKVKEHELLHPSAIRYNALHKEIAESFDGIREAICGDFIIKSKLGVRHMKAQEERDVETVTVKIEKLTEESSD